MTLPMKMFAAAFLMPLIWVSSAAWAGPDRYLGDTAIYSGSSTYLKPNVVIALDNNRAMEALASTGPAYDATMYPVTSGSYTSGKIYKSTSLGHYTAMNAPSLATLQTSCPSDYTELMNNGFVFGYIDNYSNGCVKKNPNDAPGNFYLGDKLNYEETSPTSTESAISIVQEALLYAVDKTKDFVKFGVMTIGDANKGGSVWYKVEDLSSVTFDGSSTFETTVNLIDDNLVTGNHQPLGEMLWDVGAYIGGRFGTSAAINVTTQSHLPPPYPSPIDESCQQNIALVIAMGGAVNEAFLDTKVGDIGIPADGNILVDDAAKWLAENDVNQNAADGDQYVKTYMIQVFNTETPLLIKAADKYNGQGIYYNVRDKDELVQALMDALANMVREANTGFIAPVVPASPENRTFSGDRIYLGFFYPKSQEPWWGNLKKFGLRYDGAIVDVNGAEATNPDGSFKVSARSYWSTEDDAGEVSKGGLGGVLMARNIVPTNESATDPLATASDQRKIYTYTGTDPDLDDASNAFTIANSAITTTMLGVADATERSDLMKFVHGIDAYDDDADGVFNERREWLIGDVMHSKPLILNYARYNFNTENEADCSLNKSYIWVGTNDGMLHAFRDCDGEEVWSFVPPNLVPNLRYLRETAHYYYVDGSPVAYVHDSDGDGNYEPADGDRVTLVFGTRRGAGLDTLPASGLRGAYFALDISDPEHPDFLWSLDSDSLVRPGQTTVSSDMGELGETWSTPRIGNVKVGSAIKVAAFIGAGYDNNEDLRYGSTQTFPTGITDTTDVSALSSDFTTGKSSDGGSQLNPRGRGLYVVELATLVQDVNGVYSPDFTNSGVKLWGYTHADNSAMSFSLATDVLTMDLNSDRFVDRLYAGDTGGNLWRFNVSDSTVSNWSASLVFSANPSASGGAENPQTNGRKIFYRPDALVLTPATTMVFFGSGDRAHPQNYLDPGASGAVIDRFYAVRDTDASSDANEDRPTSLSEAHLVDVTTNQLQQDYPEGDTTIDDVRYQLFDDITKYGWFIRLDTYAGEKSLSAPAIHNNVVYFSTYQPDIVASTDPCDPGNPGTARLYAVRPRTGEAVFNFWSAGGTDNYGENQDESANERAAGEDDDGSPYVLRRADREMDIGGGIPTIGSDFVTADSNPVALPDAGSDKVFPVYWMQW